MTPIGGPRQRLRVYAGVWVYLCERIWYKMPGSDLERANFHLIVDDDDAMFMTNLVIGHEEIHVFLEHSVDNPILVDEGEHVGQMCNHWQWSKTF